MIFNNAQYRGIFVFCLLGFSSGQVHSSSLVFPYQKCNKQSENYTERMVSDFSATEAAHCFECQKNGHSIDAIIKQLTKYFSSTAISKQCFLAIALRGNRIFSDDQYISCSKNNLKQFDGYTKFCIDENYVYMIHRAFAKMSQCFNFNIRRQQEAFNLINQESSGILNAQSETKARCLGQLTIDYVKEINKYIRSRKNSKPLKLSEIYDEVIKRCPDLRDTMLKDINSITCQTTHDPYICLFYTFFGMEKNYRIIQNKLNSVSDYMGTREFSNSEKQVFQLPIRVNEILNVKAIVDGQEIHWIFWDGSELYDTLRRSEKQIVILKANKIPVFENQVDIVSLFNYWAHNGGNSISRTRVISMVERLKKSIARSCKANSKEPRCLFRNQIQKGESLSATSARSFFEKDLLHNYPSKSRARRKEVAYYVRNIINTNKRTFDYKEKSNQTNTMLNFYKRAFKFKDVGLSNEEAMAFQKNVFKTCPQLSL